MSVHHLEAHVLTARQFHPELQFPFMVLLVSGGHCQLLLARGVGDYQVRGTPPPVQPCCTSLMTSVVLPS